MSSVQQGLVRGGEEGCSRGCGVWVRGSGSFSAPELQMAHWPLEGTTPPGLGAVAGAWVPAE